MNALVTGITGFVGSHLAEHLQCRGDVVTGVSRRPLRPEQASAETVSRIVWDLAGVCADRSLVDRLDRHFSGAGPDVIYHLAAESIPAACGGGGDPTLVAWRANVEGTRRVLELAAALRRPPRVVLFSSSHVYGAVDASSPPVDENTLAVPRSAYGRTKLAAEVLGAVGVACRALDVVILRSFMLAGPGQDGRLMLPEWAAQFARGGPGPVQVGSLDVRLDMIDVRDAVRAFRLVALHGASGGTYNVGSGRGRMSGEVFDELRCAAAAAGLPDAEREVRPTRPGGRFEPIADLTRLRKLGPWSPEISLQRTVTDVLADWRQRLNA